MRRAAPFLIALILAGCGSDPVADWIDAVNDKDWERACELTPKPDSSCSANMARRFGRLLPVKRDTSHKAKDGRTVFRFGDDPEVSPGGGWVRARGDNVVYEFFTIR